MISEFKLIELLKRKIPRRMQGELGIGDDAEIFKGPGKEHWVITTDAVVDGVDFRLKEINTRSRDRVRKGSRGLDIRGIRPEEAGRKALAVNLSDLAAMGAQPFAFVITLGIPKTFSEKWIEKFYAGMMRLAREHHVLCLGGDISRAKEFFASIALIGRASRNEIVTRKGARPGDLIGVTGTFGGSILGRHFKFAPRVKEARFLAQNFKPHAMMDVSDGLLQDLEHLLRASSTAARLEVCDIPVSLAALKLARGNGRKAFEHALSDGEDFELLFTLPKGRKRKLERAWKKKFPRVPLSWIGTVHSGQGVRWFCGKQELKIELRKKGYSHF